MKQIPTTTYGFENMGIGEVKEIMRYASKIRPMLSYLHKRYSSYRFKTKSVKNEDKCVVIRVA